MVCYDFYDFFFVISLHFGMKRRKRKVYLFQEEKKKKVYVHRVEPGLTLTFLPNCGKNDDFIYF